MGRGDGERDGDGHEDGEGAGEVADLSHSVERFW